MKDRVQYHVKDQLIHIEQEEETLRDYFISLSDKDHILPWVQAVV
jgi:hypothetical protein